MKALWILLGLTACDDALDQRLAIIDQPRVIAVLAEPAEARPGEDVAYTAIVASPEGPIATPPRWSYCTAPKPPTEDNAVPDGCVTGGQIIDLGTAASVTGTLPADGCLLYGPDTPPGGFRPRDADSSGGYYQPVRADVRPGGTLDDVELVAFGLSRITCNLPNAPGDAAQRYLLEYVANTNPTLDPIALDRVPADSDVELVATWPADAAESYLYFDPFDQVLVDRREAMRVSWFATAGTLPVDATLVDETDFATTASTTWHTPAPGTVFLWVVLRDSRGGIAVRELEVVVE